MDNSDLPLQMELFPKRTPQELHARLKRLGFTPLEQAQFGLLTPTAQAQIEEAMDKYLPEGIPTDAL